MELKQCIQLLKEPPESTSVAIDPSGVPKLNKLEQLEHHPTGMRGKET